MGGQASAARATGRTRTTNCATLTRDVVSVATVEPGRTKLGWQSLRRVRCQIAISRQGSGRDDQSRFQVSHRSGTMTLDV
jgi:hypothetical protein